MFFLRHIEIYGHITLDNLKCTGDGLKWCSLNAYHSNSIQNIHFLTVAILYVWTGQWEHLRPTLLEAFKTTTIITMPYIRSSEWINLLTRSLYPLTNISFPQLQPLAAIYILCFYEFDFSTFHIEIRYYIYIYYKYYVHFFLSDILLSIMPSRHIHLIMTGFPVL